MPQILVPVFLLIFSLPSWAQSYSTPDIGKSSGTIQLTNYVIHFDYQQQHLSYLCVTPKKTPQQKLVEAWFNNNLLSSAKTFYTNGQPRSVFQMNPDKAYYDLSTYHALAVAREPLLNLPFRYYLHGTCKRWSPDGKTCTIAWYKNNQWTADSISTGGHTFALADINARTHDFVLQEWLYDPALLTELLQEAEKIKLPARPVAKELRFNPDDYIQNGLVFDTEKAQKRNGHKEFTRLLNKYYRKGELISFQVTYAEKKIMQIEVNSEAIGPGEKKRMTNYLLQVLSTEGIRVNNMIAETGAISFYFHMGC